MEDSINDIETSGSRANSPADYPITLRGVTRILCGFVAFIASHSKGKGTVR